MNILLGYNEKQVACWAFLHVALCELTRVEMGRGVKKDKLLHKATTCNTKITLFTHSYCLGKVFLAFAITQNTADVEECGIFSAAGLLQQYAVVECK